MNVILRFSICSFTQCRYSKCLLKGYPLLGMKSSMTYPHGMYSPLGRGRGEILVKIFLVHKTNSVHLGFGELDNILCTAPK